MLLEKAFIKKWLSAIIIEKNLQGYETKGLEEKLNKLPASYDAYDKFAGMLSKLPFRKDWKYNEPSEFKDIKKEAAGPWKYGKTFPINISKASEKAKTAFLSSVCGCILGKPLESNPSYAEIKDALTKAKAFPLNDYVTERTIEKLGRRHPSWFETVKGKIRYVAADDDINYTIIGMLILEKAGINFTREQLMHIWHDNIPVRVSFGPERTLLLKAGFASLGEPAPKYNDAWADIFNLGDEKCGALIRADAYGYACPGLPALAAELAWKDAYMTHRKTGIYGTMYAAALISLAFVVKDKLEIFREALKYVPKKSRFYEIISDELEEVRTSSDYEDGYNRIKAKYGSYQHCKIYMEVGTMANTLKFSKNIGDGICKQVMQGNDTDSFGCTAGSILGAYYGPGYLEKRWLKPFNDEIHTALAQFYEYSLYKVAGRMSKLPALVAKELGKKRV